METYITSPYFTLLFSKSLPEYLVLTMAVHANAKAIAFIFSHLKGNVGCPKIVSTSKPILVFSLLDLSMFRSIPVSFQSRRVKHQRNLLPQHCTPQVDTCALLALSWLRRADVAVRWHRCTDVYDVLRAMDVFVARSHP